MVYDDGSDPFVPAQPVGYVPAEAMGYVPAESAGAGPAPAGDAFPDALKILVAGGFG
ncbi:ATP-binding protein, partial [Streptomyces sp. YC537]|nr:ATP-binding protein [Streptomyces boluensis]